MNGFTGPVVVVIVVIVLITIYLVTKH